MNQIRKTSLQQQLSRAVSFRRATRTTHLFPIRTRKLHCSVVLRKKTDAESSVVDSLEASSRWRKGQLTQITDKFESDEDNPDTKPQPMEINNDEEVQGMWRDMESRVTRRKSLTMEEAVTKGKKVGRSNIRKTDEEAWLSAGLYDIDAPAK